MWKGWGRGEPRPSEGSDEDLIARARRGDEDAFRAIVRRYEPAVASTIYGMLGDDPNADDLGQETFVRLHGSLGKFRGEASLKTYLTRIAMNVALTALHRRRHDRLRLVSRDGTDAPIDPQGDAEGDAEARERTALVHRALRELSPEHRAVATLRLIEGYSTRETADILAVPEGTVLSRLARASDILRRSLGPLLETK